MSQSTITSTYFKPLALPGSGFAMDDWWVWCGSVVRGPEGRFHLFASRWPKALPFHPAWLTSSEIVRAEADTVEGPYTFADVVFPARGAEYWDGRSTHNPCIRQHRGRYYLFYMGSTHLFTDPEPEQPLSMQDPRVIVGRANKRIGLAVADHPAGPWTRLDDPVLSTRPGTWRSFLVSNPTVWIEDDGSVLMIFKCRRYEGNKHSDMMLGVARAPHIEGPYTVISRDPIFGPGINGVVEDPCLWKEAGTYHLLVKDMHGHLTGQEGAIAHATSPDGLAWKLADPAVAFYRELRYPDGTLNPVAHVERPSLYLDADGRPTHLLAAVAEGNHHFQGLRRTWNQVFRL